MANGFWNFINKMVSGDLARSEDINDNLQGIQSGFDSVESDLLNSIKIVNAPGITSINLNEVARSLKVLTFDAAGDVAAVDDMGSWQGDAAVGAGTDYNERDIVKDAAGSIGLNNIYRANKSFTTTGAMAADAANWDLVINVSDVEAAKVVAVQAKDDAETAENAAQNHLILFTGQYYGSRTTAQQTNTDPNGAASSSGDLYFNSTLNVLRVFDGTSWQNISQVVETTGSFDPNPHGFTVAGSAVGSFYGWYQKINNVVHVQFSLRFTDSSHGMQGTVEIDLPFITTGSGPSSSHNLAVISVYSPNFSNGDTLRVPIGNGVSTALFVKGNSQFPGSTLQGSSVVDGTNIVVSGFYYAG